MNFSTRQPVTLQRDNLYENVIEILKIYDCKYRINLSDSNCVRKYFFLWIKWKASRPDSCSVWLMDHILHLKHADHIKTLTHFLQKYNIYINSNDIVWLVFVLISVVCDCVVEQLQYLSAVSVQSLWLWLTEVFVRLFITVWTHIYCWSHGNSDSNNLLYLQAGLHWWSEWNHCLIHCHWI